jgi:hypothetical protein
VSHLRRCSKPECQRPADATLTYVYADSTAVLGPLATYAEPHCYDLCSLHGDRMTAPRGWEIVRLEPDPDALRPSSDDLEALANLVREVGRSPEPTATGSVDLTTGAGSNSMIETGRRGHLRVLRNNPDADQ